MLSAITKLLIPTTGVWRIVGVAMERVVMVSRGVGAANKALPISKCSMRQTRDGRRVTGATTSERALLRGQAWIATPTTRAYAAHGVDAQYTGRATARSRARFGVFRSIRRQAAPSSRTAPAAFPRSDIPFMPLLLRYLRGYWKLVALALVLATINQVFSLLDPLIFRHVIDEYATRFSEYSTGEFFRGVTLLLGAAVGVAFVSRVAKNFQDYYINVITQQLGAQLYSDGIRHSLELPYSVFEDQ